MDDTEAVGPVPEGIRIVPEHPADAHLVCSGFHLSTLLCRWILPGVSADGLWGLRGYNGRGEVDTLPLIWNKIRDPILV